jgi:hypothetical protein
MATIDRGLLICDEKAWLPDENVLSDQQMAAINNQLINTIGDDTDNYPEILCKGLRAIALANQAKFDVDQRGVKREIVDEVEVEYFEATRNSSWEAYLKSLTNICPLFGYTGLNSGIGMKISPSPEIDVNPPCRVDNEILGGLPDDDLIL